MGAASPYSSDDDLDLLFHGIATTPGFATSESNFEKERKKASDWVDDQLRDRYTVPFTSPSETIIMAEANYAVGMILKSISTTLNFEFSTYNPFFLEAKSLINKLRSFITGVDGTGETNTLKSTKTGVEPTVAKSKFNRDGLRINPTLALRSLDKF